MSIAIAVLIALICIVWIAVLLDRLSVKNGFIIFAALFIFLLVWLLGTSGRAW